MYPAIRDGGINPAKIQKMSFKDYSGYSASLQEEREENIHNVWS